MRRGEIRGLGMGVKTGARVVDRCLGLARKPLSK
jgi:hypothetical protein